MKKTLVIAALGLLLTIGSETLAQTPKLSMESFKPATKGWKLPLEGYPSWSIIDVRDGMVTAFIVENYKRKLRVFDYDFNIITSREFKEYFFDVRVNGDVIDILFLIDKNKLAHMSLDTKTLETIKTDVLDVSSDYYSKRVYVSWSICGKYVGIRAGKTGKITYYDSKLNKITDEAELKQVKDLIDFPEDASLVFEDENYRVRFISRGLPPSGLISDKEYYFSWEEKDSDGNWKSLRECDFGKKEENYSGAKFKVDVLKREWLSVFIYKERFYWIEFEKYWKGFSSKNDEYRLLLKSYGREGDRREDVLSEDFKTKTIPSVFDLSNGCYLNWLQHAVQDTKSGQSLWTFTIDN